MNETHVSFSSLFQIGNLSSKTRAVRVKNVLTSQEDTIEVPTEETIAEIRERSVGKPRRF